MKKSVVLTALLCLLIIFQGWSAPSAVDGTDKKHHHAEQNPLN